MPSYKIIINPAAGRNSAAGARAVIEKMLGQAGVACDLAETRAPGHAVQLAAEAAWCGYDVIVAAGGDGTAHEVVNGLVQAAEARAGMSAARPEAALGVIPLGTGNDFAWRLGVPENRPAEACRVLLAGQRRVIDLGQVVDERGQRRIFHNHLGAGLEAATAIESNKIGRLRGLPLYLLAVLRTIPRYRQPPRVTVHYNGASLTQPMLLLAASNGRRTGGGFLIAPNASLDDGFLDLTMAGSPSIARTLWLLPHVFRGTHIYQTRYVRVERVPHFVAEAPDGLPVHLDGEIYRIDARRIAVTVLPAHLAVIGAAGA